MTCKTKRLFLASSVLFIPNLVHSQDFIRIGAAHDFQKKSIVQTFSFDLNRTEKADEKKDRAFLFNAQGVYIAPAVDLNVGNGVTSSENNVLTQVNIGKVFFGKPGRSKDALTISTKNKSFEVNPSYNSDKLFNEQLLYGQIKPFVFNFISQSFSGTDPAASYLKSVNSVAVGVFSNVGYRYSRTYAGEKFYATTGILLDYGTRLLTSKALDNWVFKVNGNCYYIASDIEELIPNDFAGVVKASIDKLVPLAGEAGFLSNLYVGITYKYGNDNPSYNLVHTLELSTKIKY